MCNWCLMTSASLPLTEIFDRRKTLGCEQALCLEEWVTQSRGNGRERRRAAPAVHQILMQAPIGENSQGHPTTVFCEISVRRSKYYLEFSIIWGGLKLSRRPLQSWTIFEAQLINSLRFSVSSFCKFNFSHFTTQVRLFFVEKRKPNFSD